MILQDWNTIRYPLSTLEWVIFLLYNFVNISMYNTNGFLLYNMFVSQKILDVVWLINVRDFEMLDDNSILLDKDLTPSNNVDDLTNIFMDQMNKFRY